MFENVNGRRTDDGRTDGRRRRTPDPWVSYKLTGEPSAQVSKKWGSDRGRGGWLVARLGVGGGVG